MIRPININLNAAHPELPLVEATTFTGAPSSVFIRGVPNAVGNWSITAVYVAVTYPDNSTTTRAAVESAEGVWVATIPGTATSGRTVAGFRILADGIDENGAAVTGYVLGFADFSVLSFTPVPAPGGTFWLLRYFDTMPTTQKKGDATVVSGVLKYYNGTTWLPFADLTNYYTKADVDPLLFAQYYPDGSVKSAAEFTQGIKYNFDTTNHTATVKPFCNTGTAANDNSSLVGRVVIPPFVDAQGNGYISDDGTRFKVTAVSGGSSIDYSTNLTDIIAPNTVTTVGGYAFYYCNALTSVSLPAATSIGSGALNSCTALASVSLPAATTVGGYAFAYCNALTSVSLPAATTVEGYAFDYCNALTSVSLPAATSVGRYAFSECSALASVDFGDAPRQAVPTLSANAFNAVPAACKIIVPYTQYDAWKAASGWSTLPQEFVRHAEKADKPATFTAGNLAALDASGNPTDSGVKASDKLDSTSAADAFSTSPARLYGVGDYCTRNGKLYICIIPTTGGTWNGSCWDSIVLPRLPLITTNGHLVSFGMNSNLVDSGIAQANVAQKGNIPYNLVTKTISDNAVTLDDRASNSVTISATLSPNTLTINFPTAPTGKLRDFAMRLNIAAGVTAPEIAWPQGVTLENNGGEVPEIADGGTGGSSTILYFSESENNGTTAKFTVKGETLTAIAQA